MNLNVNLRFIVADQEEHGAILEMAAAVKMVIRQTALMKKQGADKAIDDIDIDDVIVSLMADLQQIQDKETKSMMSEISEKVKRCICASSLRNCTDLD